MPKKNRKKQARTTTSKTQKKLKDIGSFVLQLNELANKYDFDGLVVVPVNFGSTCAVSISGKQKNSEKRIARIAIDALTDHIIERGEKHDKHESASKVISKFIRAMKNEGFLMQDKPELTLKAKRALTKELTDLGFDSPRGMDQTLLLRALNKLLRHPLSNQELEMFVEDYKSFLEIMEDF